MTSSIFSNELYNLGVIDHARCFNFTLEFGNEEYYKNKTFNRLMDTWTKYLEADIGTEDLAFEWEETILFDFLLGARFWLKQFHDADWWREDLK